MMKQTYTQLKHSINIISNELNISTKNQIQKISSTPHLLCLSVRFPGESKTIFIGRGKSVEGLWINDRWPDKLIRVKDKLLEVFRSTFKNARLLEIIQCKQNRSFLVLAKKNVRMVGVALHYTGGPCYIAKLDFEKSKNIVKLNCLWTNSKNFIMDIQKDKQEIFNMFKEYDDGTLKAEKKNESVEFPLVLLDGGTLFKKKKNNKKKKSLQNKILKIQNEINKINSCKEMQKKMIAGEMKFDGKDFVFGEFKIKFNKNMERFQKENEVFNKIKRIKGRESFHKNRLKEVETKLRLLGVDDFELVQTIEILWPSKRMNEIKHDQTSQKSEYKVYSLKNNIVMAIGLSANGNDQLRNKWSAKDDWWFHIDNEVSAHVILKGVDNPLENVNLLVIIGSIIKEQSNYLFEQIPLVFTQVKNIKGLKGSSGSVTYRNERRYTCNYDDKWKEIISAL